MQDRPFLVIRYVPLKTEWGAAALCGFGFPEKGCAALIPVLEGRLQTETEIVGELWKLCLLK